MRRYLVPFFLTVGGLVSAWAASDAYIRYEGLPMGSLQEPFILRSFFPALEVEDAVFAHHHRGARSPKYNPAIGEDVPGEYAPIDGLPAAIGVTHGPGFSYCFDTIEGRLIYAWQGGFVDTFPYWGDQELGRRVPFDYVPRVVGTLIYRAADRHPLEINGRSVSDLGKPRFVGYDLVDRQPVFLVSFGPYTVKMRVQPPRGDLTFRLEIDVEPAARLSYRSEDARYHVQLQGGQGRLTVALTGVSLGVYEPYSRQLKINAASVEAGQQLYQSYGCAACHTIDGGASHGPSLAGLYGQPRRLADGTVVPADDAYILESIKDPNAKVAEGFAPNFMPPFRLSDVEYQSLVLYIRTLAQPE